jgi:hypothetical protein
MPNRDLVERVTPSIAFSALKSEYREPVKFGK